MQLQFSTEELTLFGFSVAAIGGFITRIIPELWSLFLSLLGKEKKHYITKEEHLEICQSRLQPIVAEGKDVDKRLETGDREFDIINKKLDGVKDLISEKFDGLKDHITEKYHELDKRLTVVEQRTK